MTKEIDKLIQAYYLHNGKSPRVILLNEQSKGKLEIEISLIHTTISGNFATLGLAEYKGIPIRVIKEGENEVF